MEWTIPQIWDGTVYILGGGPSLNDVELDRLKGQHVIAVNDAFKIAPWAPFLYFMDCIWFEWNEEQVKHYGGVKVSTCARTKEHPVIRYLAKTKKDNNWDPNPKYLNRGSNSGFGATSLGLKLGTQRLERIVLFAFDMRIHNVKPDKFKTPLENELIKHNWHTNHKKSVHSGIYSQFKSGFNLLRKAANERNVEIINATPGSSLEVFPIVHPKTVYPCTQL